MRVVYVSWEYPPAFGGGIGTYVAAVAPALAARGHDVTVLTVSDHPHPQRERQDGVTIVRLPFTAIGGAEPMGTLRAWQARAESVAHYLTRLSNAGRVDLVEFADYRGEGGLYLLSTAPGQRPVCVVRLHMSLVTLAKYNARQPRYRVLEEWENQAVRAADRLVSPSAALAGELRGLLPDLGEVELSPHPVDPTFLAAPPARTEDEANEALYVGRLEERKGVETLIAAAPTLLERCPDSRLVLVGGDTAIAPGQPSMKQALLAMLPREFHARVELPGPLPRAALLERYRRARLCVFPSHFENFPNTCLEAMALGKAIVGTRNSGMAEMLVDGESGVIVPSADAAALGEALVRLYQSPAAERARLGSAARGRVEQLYHPDVVARQVEALYAGLVGGAGRREAPASPAPADRVAVVIPCFNHGRFVADALASIRAQTHAAYEIVLVDDGSTDADTLRILDELRSDPDVRIIRQENQGLSAARNTGVRATTSAYFVPLDADDRIAPDFIARLLPVLAADPALGYAYGHVEFFGAATGGWTCPEYNPRKLLVENLSVATALVRREAFDLVGGYSRDMVHGFEDWDFWLALLAVGYFGRCVPEAIFHYRKHAGGSMLQHSQQNRAAMIHKMIEHHRPLFAALLEVSLAEKDRMFFDAHMQNWQLREALARSGADASSFDAAVYDKLRAEVELDYIENSRAWKLVRRVQRWGPFGWMARVRHGRDWEAGWRNPDPLARLALIKNSKWYRLIQFAKRTPPYRWYAARKYGPQTGGA